MSACVATLFARRLRLRRDGDGLMMHKPTRLFCDGIAKFVFEPLDFPARPTAFVPRPPAQ